MKISKFVTLLIVVILTTTFVACNNRKVYDRYEHTTIAGWERNDTLLYSIPPIKDSGVYSSSVGLRLTDDYPFTAVTLIIERNVVGRNKREIDTLNCQITDKHGNAAAKGISYHQYEFALKDMLLQSGDSIQIGIRHDMKCEILPGISDVGYMLTRK